MSRLASLLGKEPLTLIVKLPDNSAELARAAEEGGADAVCLPLSEEEGEIKEVIGSVNIPVGISMGENVVSETQIKAYQNMGLDFIDIPQPLATEGLLKIKGIGRVLSLGPDYSSHELTGLSKKPIDGVDASIVQEEEWGNDLTVGDLQQYITIAMSTTLPVIVPAQKAIKASEAAIIWDTGAKGIMIGGNVTGATAATIKAVAREFRSAVEALKE